LFSSSTVIGEEQQQQDQGQRQVQHKQTSPEHQKYGLAVPPTSTLRPRRGMLYVPGSDDKKIRKSMTAEVDALCFDLEDSVAEDRKVGARETVLYALNAANGKSERLVRVNSRGTGLLEDDLEIILESAHLDGIVIPKVHTADDVKIVHDIIERNANLEGKANIKIIASIESARAIMNLKEIATASPRLDALLFAAEDFCADTGIVRSEDRRELLYARSAVVLAAKAYGLSSIDLVCIHYQDMEVLREECQEGRRLGFDAKQIIHPAQISTIQKAFSPSEQDIARAQDILQQYEQAIKAGKGAYGLRGDGSSKSTMIDAPMILQAQRMLQKAKRFGLA